MALRQDYYTPCCDEINRKISLIDDLIDDIKSRDCEADYGTENSIQVEKVESAIDNMKSIDDIIVEWDLSSKEIELLREVKDRVSDKDDLGFKEPIDYAHAFSALASILNAGEIANLGTNGQTDDAGGWLLDFVLILIIKVEFHSKI